MEIDASASGPPGPCSPPGGPPGQSPGWIAYSLGGALNRARWQIEQAPFSAEALPEGGIKPLLVGLIPQGRLLLAERAAVRFEAVIHRCIAAWEWWSSSEDAGGEIETTAGRYKRRAGGEPRGLAMSHGGE